jgi:hypothetical protein
MIDYVLRFPSKQVAEQFGLANGFAQHNEDGVIFSTLASHEHALLEIGPHNGENYWILFRDLVGIPIPAGADQFIYWASDWTVLDEDGLETHIPRPVNNPDVPNVFWA